MSKSTQNAALNRLCLFSNRANPRKDSKLVPAIYLIISKINFEKSILMTFLIFCCLFISNNAFSRQNWKRDNISVTYNVVEGAITMKLLIFDYDFGPASENGYLEWCNFLYSYEYVTVRNLMRVEVGDQKKDNWTWANLKNKIPGAKLQLVNCSVPTSGSILADNTEQRVEVSTVDNKSYLTVKWLVGPEYQTIKRVVFRGQWHVNGAYGGDKIDYESFDVNIPVMSDLIYDGFTFTDSKDVQIKWKKNGNTDLDKISKLNLVNQSDQIQQSFTIENASSGTFTVPQSTSMSSFKLKQSYLDFVKVTQGFDIPAFSHPLTLQGNYSPVTNKMTLNWTIDQAVGDKIESCKFLIERSPTSDFSEDVVKVADVDYDPKLTSYQYEESLSNAPSLRKSMFYRIKRNYEGFSWKAGITGTTTLSHALVDPSQVTLALLNGKAKLNWGTSGVWSDGSKLVITRVNETLKESAEIVLDKEDYYKGAYTDDYIALCNRYSYKLQVIPGDKSFSKELAATTSNSIMETEIGTLKSLEVSKGYFSDRVELHWNTLGAFDYFLIKRKPYDSEESFRQIAQVSGTKTSDFYQTDDTKSDPGVYYTYQIIGVVKCADETIISKDTLTDVGFRTPSGNIYGRITYENGQAVSGAEVLLEGDNQSFGKSILFNGTDSYLQVNKPFNLNNDFTIQTWVAPDKSAMPTGVIMSKKDEFALGFTPEGKLYFTMGSATLETGYTRTEGVVYNHVSVSYKANSLKIYINGEPVASKSDVMKPESTKNPLLIGKSIEGQYYKGNIDEVRVWDIALTPEEILRDYNRLLYGGEKGLKAYWRFDEIIKNAFYDISYQNNQYNENHGTVFNAIKDEVVVPTSDQLTLKGIADNAGTYSIAGIPYSGNGTMYTLIPRYGTHQFDPNQQKRLIATGSLSHTCDFVDKSSFEVTGRVYYSGGNVPVSGVSFQIDGSPATKNNKIVETAPDGLFTIRVPVGFHEVKAVKNFHVFEKGGLIIDSQGNNLNYQTTLDGIVLYDSTRVKFIGRVAGGAIQDAFPLAHSLSKNNLGDKAVVTLVLPGYPGNEISKKDTIEEFTHFLPSNKVGTAPNKNKVKYSQSSVEIYPNTRTGEFVAMLIPENFNVTSVNVTGEKYGNILPNGNSVNIDLTQKYIELKSVNEYVDSIPDPTNSDIKKKVNYSDTVKFNASYKFIKRFNPDFTIKQLSGSKELDYYGDSTVVVNDIFGKLDTIRVYTPEKGYLFNNPVYRQNNKYKLRVKAFESYPYYDGDGYQTSTDNVATTDGMMYFTNGMLDNAPTSDTIKLDKNGIADYQFICGKPEIVNNDGLKRLNASLKIGETTLAWLNRIEALVMGGVSIGNTFITAGPDVITTVLRDPPGSESYSFLEAGTTIQTTDFYVPGLNFRQEIGSEVDMSVYTVLVNGLGVAEETETITGADNKYLGILSENSIGQFGKVTKITTTNRWQTSSSKDFVGAMADVYIGNSTNIITGILTSLTPILKKNFNPSKGKIIVDTDYPDGYCFIRGEALGLGVTFATTFAYTQGHIEYVLIPKIKELRAQVLMPNTTTEADAQQIANASFKQVYVSRLPLGDKKFGLLNTDDEFGDTKSSNINYDDGPSYKIYYPKNNKDGSEFEAASDTILTLNQSIKNWEKAIENNEKAKLLAKGGENYSFDGGSKITNTYNYSSVNHRLNSFETVVGFKSSVTSGAFLNKVGTKLIINTNQTTSHGRFKNTDQTATKSFGFFLGETGSNYLSVDVKRVTNKGNFSSVLQSDEIEYDKNIAEIEFDEYVFITRAGATSCPYEEGYKSKYYKKGTIIDQPTAKVEVPVINVENPTMTNVPANRNATFKLVINNGSETKAASFYTLRLREDTNPNGATFFMDGAPIGTGRSMFLLPSVPVKKILEVGKGTVMDYDNLQLILNSSCEYDLADTITIGAHFIPSCSDVHVAYPNDAWTLNAETKNVTPDNRYFLPIKLDNFDVNFANFDHIKIQYKPSAASDAEWVTLKKFYADADKMAKAQGEKGMINGSTINYDFILGDLPDQRYDICAVSVCKVLNDEIQTVSNIVKGIKDTYRPRLFGSPQPANGILGIEDEIRLNFNESIAQGLLVADNFEVKGIRNGTRSNHSAAVRFDGIHDYVATELERNLTGKDFTVEMSLLVDKKGASTIFSHGNVNESFEFGFTEDNKLQVKVGSEIFTSQGPLEFKPGEWEHIAVTYHTGEQPRLTAFYNYVEVLNREIGTVYKGIGNYEIGRSIASGNNYFTGKIHELRIWNKVLALASLTKYSGIELAGNELGLLSYYPMTESKGSIILDKARGVNALMKAQWYIDRIGLSAQFDKESYLKLSTGALPISIDQDYTIEFWFKGSPGQTNATLVSNGRGDHQEFGGSDKLFFIGFNENGKLVFRNKGIEIVTDGGYLDNDWHHYALAVNRNISKGYIYIDGEQKNFFDADHLGSIAAPNMYLGARKWLNKDDQFAENIDMYYQGFIDEFRIWNTFKNQTLINKENSNRLTGSEMGLLAYYPFETYIDQQGLKEMIFSVADQTARGTSGIVIPDAEVKGVLQSTEVGKVKDPGGEGSISVKYIVNNDALIIQPEAANGWDEFEQRIVSFKVNNVRDLNGNKIASPISWSAFIDRNQLRWSEEEFNISKMENEPLEFTLSISNVGGNVRRYSIENAPGWLNIEPSSGSINPKSTVKIKFTVDKSLNIGSYDEVIYLVNENNVSRALSLNITVKGKKPDWTVNPKDFKYTMSVYGKLKINNIFSVDKDDLLAAFIDGKCVGVANCNYKANIDMWYSFLTVYCNEKQKSGLEFRIWDNSTGKIYLAQTAREISFLNNAVVGEPDAPIIFNGHELTYQDISLNKGWNWISFNLNNTYLNNVKQTLINGTWKSGDEVKSQNAFDSYSTQNTWVGTLSKNGGFNNTSMYLINSSTEQTLSTSGISVDMKANPITVKPGWNYIGYLPTVNMTVLEALANYDAAKGDVIKSQSEFAIYSENKGWFGNLRHLEPGKGYMLYRNTSAKEVKFNYPSIGGSLVKAVSKQKSRFASKVSDKSITPLFAENMSVIAIADHEFEMNTSDVIKAYAENALRGIGTVVFNYADGKPVTYISVAGEKETPVTFVVERDEKIIAQTEPVINYRSNAVIGSVEKPLILKFKHTPDNLTIYPSPFKEIVNITIDDPQAKEVEFEIYDINGRLVMKSSKALINNGSFHTTWDGKTAGGASCELGIYLIHIIIDGQTTIHKVEKQ